MTQLLRVEGWQRQSIGPRPSAWIGYAIRPAPAMQSGGCAPLKPPNKAMLTAAAA